MPLKLYKTDISPPVCAALMICEIHNVPVEKIDVNFLKLEQFNPDYVKKNPVHTVPLLEDDDLIIHDSHVILTYLTEKYGKDESLYPKDLKKRAQVDQKLFLDTLIFFRIRAITTPAIFEGVRKPTEKQLKDLKEAYTFLEAFLSKTKFVAGDNMTIADISLLATVNVVRYIIPMDCTKYPKVHAWFTYMKNQSFYKKCIEPVTAEIEKLIKEPYRSPLLDIGLPKFAPDIMARTRVSCLLVTSLGRRVGDYRASFVAPKTLLPVFGLCLAGLGIIIIIIPNVHTWFTYMKNQSFYKKIIEPLAAEAEKLIKAHMDL